MQFKRNQVEGAIFQTLGARNVRVKELKFRLKRLLVTDRRLSRNASNERGDRHYAFYSGKPPGSGVEVMFSGYEAFALLAAVMLLEHGIPQTRVIRVMRQIRRQLEAAHARNLKNDPRPLFDQEAILRQARPGDFAVTSTEPVFLLLARLPDSKGDTGPGGSVVAVCEGSAELRAVYKKHSVPGMVATFFEFSRLIHALAANLLQSRPVKRGR